MNNAKFSGAALVAVAVLLAAAGAAVGREAEGEEYGSGVFGRWTKDAHGLPAYEYTMALDDPRAAWDPALLPQTSLHWHHLGNDRVNANAYNNETVKMFYGESGAMWLNEYQPEEGAHAGGFGWVIYGNTVLVDRDEYAPEGAMWERTFGTGYFRKRLGVPGMKMERTVFAPAGDLPALVSELTLKNLSGATQEITVIEYWDVNMRLLADFLPAGALRAWTRDEKAAAETGGEGSILSAVPRRRFGPHGGFPDRPIAVDPETPAVFLAGLNVKPGTWITDPVELFEQGRPVSHPAGLKAAGKETVSSKRLEQKKLCLAAKVKIKLAPGGTKTLRFAFGYEKGKPAADTVKLLAKDGGSRLLAESMQYWSDRVPRFRPDRASFMSRELAWSYYYFTSSALYDGYYQKHHVPQGGNYLYKSGGNGAARDYAAFVQALTYYRPELAREVLEFMMRCQERDGRLFYDFEGFGMRYSVPYRPGDLDIWFLWALAEYVFATRDFAFLDYQVPYYPLHRGCSGTVWDHARASLDRLVNVIGTGPHGHPRLRLSDWNDEMTFLTAGSNPVDMIATFYRGESVMNTAMCCVMLPLFADLAGMRGDAEAEAAARDYLAGMRAALDEAWRDDHFIRSYSGLGRVFGDEDIYLEPQAWALLAGDVLPPEQEKILVETVVARLKKPSALGMMISTSTSGSMTTRPGEQEEGGIWFAINGPAAVALSKHDPGLGWQEVMDNTLGRHAHLYPELWYGIWSGPDAWNSIFSDRPGKTWYMKTPLFNTGPQMYPVQNAHSHCQTLWATARMAGVTPTAGGWLVEPRIPMQSYSFDCALFGVSVEPGRIAGRASLPEPAPLTIMVRVPQEWDAVQVRENGRALGHRMENGLAVFELPKKPQGQNAEWEVSAR